MEEFDQLAAPGYPVFLGSEFEQPAEVDALFQVRFVFAPPKTNIGFRQPRRDPERENAVIEALKTALPVTALARLVAQFSAPRPTLMRCALTFGLAHTDIFKNADISQSHFLMQGLSEEVLRHATHFQINQSTI